MHTKGKLEQCDYTQRELWIGADYHIATVHGNQTFREANAQRLVKCWNEYGSLKAKADVCDELVEALKIHGEHSDKCYKNLTIGGFCDCGLEQALAKAERIE